MAKKEQNVMLLQEVVGQLRKLNATSVRDRLREAEEAKRAEKIALMGEEQEETQSSIVDSTEDFRRRFIAGQAKTFTDTNITKTAEGRKNTERNDILKDINRNILEGFYYQSPATPEGAVGVVDTFTGLIKVNTDSLVQNLSTLKNINFQMLDFMKTSRKEDNLRYNTQQRSQEEARKEAINLNKLSFAGAGAVAGGALALPSPDDEDNGDNSTTSAVKGSLITVAALKAWKWTKGIAAAFTAWGKKLFSKFKLTPKQVKMLANPRKWPFVLAGVIAAGFLGASIFGGDGEDSSSDDVLPGDLEDLPEQSALASNMDTLFTVALTGGILSKSKLVQNVAKSVGNKVSKAYKAAPKTSLRGRLYKNPAFQKGLKLGGRGLLRFMGPWGFGAWVAWELGSFVLKKFNNQEKEAEGALREIEDVQMQSIDSVLGDPDLEAMFKDPTGPMKFGSAAKKNTMKQRIRMLMEGKSIEQKNKLKKELMTLGWTASELSPLMGSTSTYSPLNKDRDGLMDKLELQEKDRTTEFGMSPGHPGSLFNSGNTIVGDTINTSHVYVTGYVPSAFEAKRHHLAKGPR
jgi:hypothetical protein